MQALCLAVMSDPLPCAQAHAEPTDALMADLRRDGYARLTPAVTRTLLQARGGLGDWPAFAAAWDDLGTDTYLAATGRRRRRRHGAFVIARGQPPQVLPPQPHYQRLQYNPLQGGVARWFAPLQPDFAASLTLTAALTWLRDVAEYLQPYVRTWHCEVHPFRIEASGAQAGEPTPEGMHRDGVDWVLVLLVQRHNIAEGVTRIADPAGRDLGHFTLAEPLEAVVLDDRRVLHGVTPVRPLDAARPAWRDVLVLTLRAEDTTSTAAHG